MESGTFPLALNPEKTLMTRPASRPILLITLLAMVSLVGYALRSNITIAQEYMAPELGLTMNDMGTITAWGFQLAYALFQIPAGFLGDRYGARVVLGLAVTGWAIASLASGLVPAVAGSAFLMLFGARVLLGIAQAATYPVGSMAVAQSIPAHQRTTANSIYIAAATLGSALAPLTLAPLMVQAGWRSVFIASGVVGLITALVWFVFAPVELRRRPDHVQTPIVDQFRASLRLLRDRDLMLLSTSYLLHSAVFFVFIFWFFRYLTEGRGFTVLASGFWGSVPYFMAFAFAPMGGMLADWLGRRSDPGIARRRVAMTCLMVAATLVVIGANLPSPYLAIAALGLSVAAINGAEGSFWATATSLGRSNPGAAGGVLNLMGNLGGVISIWAVPRMKDALGWTTMLGVWAAVSVIAGLLWLAVRVDRTEPAATA
jgi:ACS family glucarate transporter-like MFS transporter